MSIHLPFSMIFPSFFRRFFLCFTASLFWRFTLCAAETSDDANFHGLSEALPNGFLNLEPENWCVLRREWMSCWGLLG
jgi:hypothetical protein